jgi:hypothetical protein
VPNLSAQSYLRIVKSLSAWIIVLVRKLSLKKLLPSDASHQDTEGLQDAALVEGKRTLIEREENLQRHAARCGLIY